jgi:hypothetical protein
LTHLTFSSGKRSHTMIAHGFLPAFRHGLPLHVFAVGTSKQHGYSFGHGDSFSLAIKIAEPTVSEATPKMA